MLLKYGAHILIQSIADTFDQAPTNRIRCGILILLQKPEKPQDPLLSPIIVFFSGDDTEQSILFVGYEPHIQKGPVIWAWLDKLVATVQRPGNGI